MKYILLTLLTLGFLNFSGCGYKEGVSTSAAKSYFYFTGFSNMDKSIEVSIDGGERFSVKPSRDNQYSIKPGKHLVKVYRDGELKVQREVYVGDGIAKEIEVK
jgi:hypothetical protein